MATLRYFIRVAKKSPKANIRVRFKQGSKFDLSAKTPIEIKPDYWNNDKGELRQRAQFINREEISIVLDNLRSHIISEYNNTPDKSKIDGKWLISAIDKYYNPNKYLQDNTTLFGFIQHFINNSDKRINLDTGKPVCYKMQREYEVTFNYLKEYAKKNTEPDFVDIDLEFYQKFTSFLREKELKINTIGKKIQTLKIFLNAAANKGINPYLKYKSKNFKVLTEEVDNIYLNKKELAKLYECDLSKKPSLERVRDLFIVGCWTGLRFSDLKQITQDKIQGDFISIKQKKTGRGVIIPIHSNVIEILDKYNGELPNKISNQKYNEYLKKAVEEAGINNLTPMKEINNGLEVEKKVPKYKLVSSHTARRSFCTNAYEDGIPTLAIMSISGHKTEKAFLKYIKADAKTHAKKVLDIWRKNGDFISKAK